MQAHEAVAPDLVTLLMDAIGKALGSLPCVSRGQAGAKSGKSPEVRILVEHVETLLLA